VDAPPPRAVRNAQCFRDVGANIGTTCIPIVREAGCRALAIEPVSENFSRLRQNVAANGLADRIALANNAVVRQPGTLKMRLTEGRSGGHFAARSGKAADPGVTDTCETVEADTLPAIIAAAGLSTGEIAFVWIDVQGCEPEVIESGGILWENGVPVWSEVEPRSLRIQGEPYAFADVAAAISTASLLQATSRISVRTPFPAKLQNWGR
jgi:FkbM family methyltransferase